MDSKVGSPKFERKKDDLEVLDGKFDSIAVNFHVLMKGGKEEEVWKVLMSAARLGKISAVIGRESMAELSQGEYRAEIHLLHALSMVGRSTSQRE